MAVSSGLPVCRVGVANDQPAGADRFDAGGDDVFEQRILDHSLAVGLDHRFVRAARLRNRVAMDGVGQLQQPVVARHRLLAPTFEQLARARLACRRRVFQAIATCRHSRAIVERNSSRWPRRWASSSSSNSVPSAYSSIMSASKPSSVLSR